jgi:hypothetical protein
MPISQGRGAPSAQASAATAVIPISASTTVIKALI